TSALGWPTARMLPSLGRVMSPSRTIAASKAPIAKRCTSGELSGTASAAGASACAAGAGGCCEHAAQARAMALARASRRWREAMVMQGSRRPGGRREDSKAPRRGSTPATPGRGARAWRVAGWTRAGPAPVPGSGDGARARASPQRRLLERRLLEVGVAGGPALERLVQARRLALGQVHRADPRAVDAAQVVEPVADVIEHHVGGVALALLGDRVAVAVEADLDRVGVAEQVVDVAQDLLVGADQEERQPEIGRASCRERVSMSIDRG